MKVRKAANDIKDKIREILNAIVDGTLEIVELIFAENESEEEVIDMERLTEKIDDNYIPIMDKKIGYRACMIKLGKLEDLEEQIGMNLNDFYTCIILSMEIFISLGMLMIQTKNIMKYHLNTMAKVCF